MCVTLRSYLTSILAERDVSRRYAANLHQRLASFGDYLGREALLEDLSPEVLNAWIAHLQESTGWVPKTIRHYQAAVVLVWRAAFERQAIDRPPWRLMRIKVPKRIVRAWTLDELRAILAATKWLKGDVPGTSIWKRDWMRAFILTAYCTGYRRCDLMHHALREDLRDGVLTVTECKTGKVIARRLSTQALLALERVEHEKYLLPWDGGSSGVRGFYASFRVLVRHAGVSPGGPHKIRKSAGSYAQRANGNGQALLGHEQADTFHRHYHDRSISQQVPEPPPDL
jgi:integrase